jgi:uncharacterized protein (DUF2267 family)
MEVITMTRTGLDVFDTTIQMTNEWLRDISQELGDDNRRHAYLALRGTLHALRDFLPLDESAQLSAQLPLLIRGLYFEGWKPSRTPETDRTLDSFLQRVDDAMERALWNEAVQYDAQQATQAVLRVLATHVSNGEMHQIMHTMPQHVRDLWPEIAMSR